MFCAKSLLFVLSEERERNFLQVSLSMLFYVEKLCRSYFATKTQPTPRELDDSELYSSEIFPAKFKVGRACVRVLVLVFVVQCTNKFVTNCL